MAQKAKRGLIYLGQIPLDVYQMPDGQYELYTTSIEEAVQKYNRNHLRSWLATKSAEALECQGFDLRKISEVEVEGSNFPIKPVPIRVAIAYWKYEYKRGNQLAGALLTACAEESIERRADAVFNATRTEEERQQQFSSNFTPEAIAQQQLLDKQMALAHLQLEAARAQAEVQAKTQGMSSMDVYESIKGIALRLVREGNVKSELALSYELSITAKSVPELKEAAEEGKRLLSAQMVVPEIPKSPTELATELNAKFGRKDISNRKVNIALESFGWQYKDTDKQWKPTEDGKPYCEMLIDSTRQTGKTVFKLRWFSSVIPKLEEYFAALPVKK